jgi:hypothetical protein
MAVRMKEPDTEIHVPGIGDLRYLIITCDTERTLRLDDDEAFAPWELFGIAEWLKQEAIKMQFEDEDDEG